MHTQQLALKHIFHFFSSSGKAKWNVSYTEEQTKKKLGNSIREKLKPSLPNWSLTLCITVVLKNNKPFDSKRPPRDVRSGVAKAKRPALVGPFQRFLQNRRLRGPEGGWRHGRSRPGRASPPSSSVQAFGPGSGRAPASLGSGIPTPGRGGAAPRRRPGQAGPGRAPPRRERGRPRSAGRSRRPLPSPLAAPAGKRGLLSRRANKDCTCGHHLEGGRASPLRSSTCFRSPLRFLVCKERPARLSAPLRTSSPPLANLSSPSLPVRPAGRDSPTLSATRIKDHPFSSVPPPLGFCSKEGRKRRQEIVPEFIYLPAVLFSCPVSLVFFYFGLKLSKAVARRDWYLVNQDRWVNGTTTCSYALYKTIVNWGSVVAGSDSV